MKSKVEVNKDGINYLRKGESPKIVSKGSLMTELQVMRDSGPLNFKVANNVMELWFYK